MEPYVKLIIPVLLICSLLACNDTANTAQTSLAPVQEETPFSQTGEASYYARSLEGQPMASGDKYRKDSLVAAHRTLPLGTIVEVTNLSNGQKVEVEILDRGPHVRGRIIDLSRAAAQRLGFVGDGLTDVKIEVVAPAEGYSVSDSTVR